MNLSDFSLLKEAHDHYVIGHPKGKSLNVPKQGLSAEAIQLISKLKRYQNFEEGGDTDEEEAQPDTDTEEETPQRLPAAESPDENTGEEDTGEEELGQQGARHPAGFIDDAWGAFKQGVQSLTGVAPTTNLKEAAGSSPPGTEQVQELMKKAAPAAPPKEPVAAEAEPKQEAAPVAPEPESKPPEKTQESISALKAAGEQGQKALMEGAQNLEKLETPDQIFESEKAKDAKFEEAYANKEIDPSHFMSSLGTESKIAAGIAMILGGIGSGMTGGPNLAFQAIQKSMDRDIDAQKQSKSGKLNLWKMNRQAYGSKVAANIATSKQLLNVAIVKAKAAAAMNPSLIVQAKMAPAIAAMEKDRDQKNFLLSQMTGPSNGSSTLDPATLVSALVPKHLQKEAFAQIKAAQDTKRMGTDIMQAFEQAAKEQTFWKTGAGMLRTAPGVLALHQSLQPTFPELEKTVRQAAMTNTFTNITPAAGDFESTTNSKRNNLRKYLRSRASVPLLKGFGIDLAKFQSTSALGHEPGSIIKLKNGKKYKVGEDGDTLSPL